MNAHRIFLEECTRNCSSYHWEGNTYYFIVYLLEQLENFLVTKGLARWRKERHFLRSDINTQKTPTVCSSDDYYGL